MSDEIKQSEDEKMDRDDDGLDPALQKEIDEALGNMSIEDLADEGKPSARPRPLAPPGPGEGVRRGTVVAVQGDDIFVDMGLKDQGILPVEQFDGKDLPAEGHLVEFTVEGFDEDEGLWMLSREGAILAATWDTLRAGQAIEARVTGHNRGGLEMTISGIRAFMPVSQIERFGGVEDMSGYVGQKLACQVAKIDYGNENVILSRRALLDAQAEQAKAQLFETLQEGDVVTGTIRSIMPYGAFVDIGGADGLLHVRDMSHSRVEDPTEVVAEGQEVEVVVLKVDREEKKIALGLKQIAPDPWLGVEGRFPEDQIVTGRVTKLMDFGAFVELAEGLEGLIPISELTFERRVGHPREVVNEGDMVRVRVLSVDPERKRVSLSLKRAGEDPWIGASVRWPVDGIVEGNVTRIADFGAFVKLATGVEGLIHISELAENRVHSVHEVVREGQLVQAKVLSVDEEQRRMSLSIKQLAASPGYTGTTDEANSSKPKKRRKKPLKGGLD